MNKEAALERYVQRFAKVLFDPTDTVEIRPLPPNKGTRIWCKAEELHTYAIGMQMANENGADIFVGVLPRNGELGEDEDCLDGRVAWADFDHGATREKIEMLLDSLGVPAPTMMIDSGHGTHCYWRFTNKVPPEKLAELVDDMSVTFHSDPKVKNPSRVMRVPGFYNLKYPEDKVPCRIHYSNSIEYAYEGFRQIIPKSEKPVEKPPTRQFEGVPFAELSGDQNIRAAVAYIDRVENCAAGDGRNNAAFRVSAILQNDFVLSENDAWNILADWNIGNSPPLGEKELRTAFNSAKKHAKRPTGNKIDRPKVTASASAPPQSDLEKVLREELEGKRKTIPLPWPALDTVTNALKPGTITIIAGPPNTSKSFFAMFIALGCQSQKVPWSYMPLEDTKLDFDRRLLAIFAENWEIINDAREQHLEEYAKYNGILTAIGKNVYENPRMQIVQHNGKIIVPDVPYQFITEWATQQFEDGKRVIFIDPLAQIDFDGNQQWKDEATFIRELLAIASKYQGSIVLVAHRNKAPGREGLMIPTVDDLQGSAAFGRLCHTVMFLSAHESKESKIKRAGIVHEAEHNRTVSIVKARNGSGARLAIAFQIDDRSPIFNEVGVISLR